MSILIFMYLCGGMQQHCPLKLLSSLDGAMQFELICSKAAVSEFREVLLEGCS